MLLEKREQLAIWDPRYAIAPDESTPGSHRILVNDELCDTERTLRRRFVASYRHAGSRRERNKKKCRSARNEKDPSVRAWHLRERLYRKGINA